MCLAADKSAGKSEIMITELVSHIHEAENVLKYSLHLGEFLKSDWEQNISKSNAIDKYIDAIIKDCSPFFDVNDCTFFGRSDPFYGQPNKDKDLSILHGNANFWRHAIKQDVILFAFNTLRKVIGESFVLSPSNMVLLCNYTITTRNHHELYDNCPHGLDYLTTTSLRKKDRELPLLSLTANGPSELSLSYRNRCEIKNIESIGAFSSDASNSKRRIDNIYNSLTQSGLSISSLYSFQDIINESNQKGKSLPYVTLSTFEFYDYIVTRRNSNTKTNIYPILNAFKEKKYFSLTQYNNYIDSVNHLLTSIGTNDIDKYSLSYDLKPNNNLLLSDRIYLRYQIEKIFAPSTISCLYQNVAATQGTFYSLCDQPTINLLASCLRLPNVFTRQYILQMAVDYISKHYDYNFAGYNFFSEKMKSPESIMLDVNSRTSFFNQHSKLEFWKKRYFDFITYLSQMVFPIYENFFSVLFGIFSKDKIQAQQTQRMF